MRRGTAGRWRTRCQWPAMLTQRRPGVESRSAGVMPGAIARTARSRPHLGGGVCGSGLRLSRLAACHVQKEPRHRLPVRGRSGSRRNEKAPLTTWPSVDSTCHSTRQAPGVRARTRAVSVSARPRDGHRHVQRLAGRPHQADPGELLLDAIVEAQHHFPRARWPPCVGAREPIRSGGSGPAGPPGEQDCDEESERAEDRGDQRQSSRTRCDSSS